MSSSTLIEVFGHIVFSFTREVAKRYNPEEPEFTTECFGYDPLQSTGREWYYHPVDELIYQEYSDREATSLDYPASRHLDIKVIDACSPEQNEETQEDQQDEDRAMAWKRLRPSAFRTVCKSMYVGASISLLTAIIMGSVYLLITYLSYKTKLACHFSQTIPLQVQWLRTICGIISSGFIYMWNFAGTLFLFRPYQLMGLKRKMFLVSCLGYVIDVLYRVVLQVFGISHSQISLFQKIPLNVIFFLSACGQIYHLTNHFRMRRSKRQQVTFGIQMILPGFFCFFLCVSFSSFIYPAYNERDKEGKLLIAVFAPLSGTIVKVISRISVQRLRNITHPGYSYALLVPLYFGSAVLFRVLQADLGSVESIAVLGIIHGAAEVVERSIMVVIDHICHVIWKRASAPWGSFRTPRRERLMADIAIMSMLYESTAVVTVNGFLFFYQMIYRQNDSLLKLLQSFAVRTSVPLVIEWFFTSVSLAIETRYQNMAVMAVWRKRWKRHILVAVVNAVPLALWTSTNLIEVVHGRFDKSNQNCKMPFT